MVARSRSSFVRLSRRLPLTLFFLSTWTSSSSRPSLFANSTTRAMSQPITSAAVRSAGALVAKPRATRA